WQTLQRSLYSARPEPSDKALPMNSGDAINLTEWSDGIATAWQKPSAMILSLRSPRGTPTILPRSARRPAASTPSSTWSAFLIPLRAASEDDEADAGWRNR